MKNNKLTMIMLCAVAGVFVPARAMQTSKDEILQRLQAITERLGGQQQEKEVAEERAEAAAIEDGDTAATEPSMDGDAEKAGKADAAQRLQGIVAHLEEQQREKEAAEREEAERLRKEQEEREQREQREREAAEKKAQEEREQREREAAAKKEQEEREQQEREQREREAAAKKEQEEREQQEREQREREAAAKREQEEREQQEREQQQEPVVDDGGGSTQGSPPQSPPQSPPAQSPTASSVVVEDDANGGGEKTSGVSFAAEVTKFEVAEQKLHELRAKYSALYNACRQARLPLAHQIFIDLNKDEEEQLEEQASTMQEALESVGLPVPHVSDVQVCDGGRLSYQVEYTQGEPRHDSLHAVVPGSVAPTGGWHSGGRLLNGMHGSHIRQGASMVVYRDGGYQGYPAGYPYHRG